ncbi:hypothetical protein Tco_1434757 [Tanacetum coccineum]
MEQMLLAKQDEAGVILTDEQNDFLFADASRMEEIEELNANICLMARIQPADHTSNDGPSYEYAFISEVQSSSIDENNEPMYPTHTKIINSTIGDDQINNNIKFDSFKGNVNSGSVEKDTHVPDLYLEAKLKKNVDLILKLGNSLQGMTILYVASSLGNLEIPLNVRDSEDTLEDAFKKMKDVFESTESKLDELEKKINVKDQLLEGITLYEWAELSVWINHECVDKILNAELEKVKKKSFKIQEDLQARIKILEKDVQRYEKQSVDFQLKLQHEKEKQKWDSTSKNKITIPLDYSWISKIEKLEDENVSLDFTVQSLIKE